MAQDIYVVSQGPLLTSAAFQRLGEVPREAQWFAQDEHGLGARFGS